MSLVSLVCPAFCRFPFLCMFSSSLFMFSPFILFFATNKYRQEKLFLFPSAPKNAPFSSCHLNCSFTLSQYSHVPIVISTSKLVLQMPLFPPLLSSLSHMNPWIQDSRSFFLLVCIPSRFFLSSIQVSLHNCMTRGDKTENLFLQYPEEIKIQTSSKQRFCASFCLHMLTPGAVSNYAQIRSKSITWQRLHMLKCSAAVSFH